MSGYQGHYSLIQYCPDLSRAEAANVGVLLFCPQLGFIDARTSGGNDRVRRFFRGREIDVARLNIMKRSIERRLRAESTRFKSVEDLVAFIDTRANEMVVTPPRPMKVVEPRADLDKLFEELVGGRVRSEKATALIPELDAAFIRLQQEGRGWTKEHVTVPVLGTTIKAPYAYRNGVINLVKPQKFGTVEDEARRAAGHLAIEGDLLRKHPNEAGGEYRLVVVSAGHGEASLDRERSVGPLFEEYGVRFVARAQVPAFVEQVEREAHR
jgi:Protein of unknown function (DUF3037)